MERIYHQLSHINRSQWKVPMRMHEQMCVWWTPDNSTAPLTKIHQLESLQRVLQSSQYLRITDKQHPLKGDSKDYLLFHNSTFLFHNYILRGNYSSRQKCTKFSIVQKAYPYILNSLLSKVFISTGYFLPLTDICRPQTKCKIKEATSQDTEGLIKFYYQKAIQQDRCLDSKGDSKKKIQNTLEK